MSLFKTQFNYFILISFIFGHIVSIYGFFIAISIQTNSKTLVYHFLLANLALLGALIGAHRLWSHRSFKANRFVEVMLVILETYSAQSSVFDWARDHRVHHKYVDTDADPYNVNRGLFYSQIGWLCLKKTNEFKEKVKTINVDDLTSDQLVMFQKRYHPILVPSLWIVSAYVPHVLWNESYLNSISVLILAIIISIHHVGTINSLAHFWGWKPYDTKIEPTFSRLVAYLTMGEGYHNFHHTFPKDYTQSELHWSKNFNLSALVINALEYIGWVKNAHRENKDMIAKRRERTGNMAVEIQPWSYILDQILGLMVVNWHILLIFGIRYYNQAEYFA